MKTIKIDDKEIKISDESYQAFKEQFLSEDWKPEVGKRYWTICEDNSKRSYIWGGWPSDYYRLNTNNVFRTKEETKKQQVKNQALADINQYIRENDLRAKNVDWKNYMQQKFHIFYNYDDCEFDWGYRYSINRLSLIGELKSAEACEKILDNKEKELKIIFNIK